MFPKRTACSIRENSFGYEATIGKAGGIPLGHPSHQNRKKLWKTLPKSIIIGFQRLAQLEIEIRRGYFLRRELASSYGIVIAGEDGDRRGSGQAEGKRTAFVYTHGRRVHAQSDHLPARE